MAHSPEVKAQCMGEMIAGAELGDISRRYNVSTAALKKWRTELTEYKAPVQVVDQFELAQASRQERFLQRVESMAHQLFVMLETQSQVASDPDYIRKHNPADLAVLTGALADRGIRILDAVRGINPGPGRPRKS